MVTGEPHEPLPILLLGLQGLEHTAALSPLTLSKPSKTCIVHPEISLIQVWRRAVRKVQEKAMKVKP